MSTTSTSNFPCLYDKFTNYFKDKYDNYKKEKSDKKEIENRSGFHSELESVEKRLPKNFDDSNREEYAWLYFMSNCTGFDCFYDRFEKINENIDDKLKNVDSNETDKINKFKEIVEECHMDDGITNHYS